MKRQHVLLLGSVLLLVAPVLAQGLPPLGEPARPTPQSPAPAAGASASLTVAAANADLKTARTANQEKRYSDAETLMLKDTAARPEMPYLWIELGLAQLGAKKYPDAEVSFKAALGNGPAPAGGSSSGGFYAADGKGTHSGVNISGQQATSNGKDNSEIDGISYASLGEVYIHTNHIPEAKAAYDEAVKANPAQAALYLRNETIFFLQAGNAVEQVEAASMAIAVDPTRAVLYFYKGQGLAAQATIDAKTQKLILPAGCAEALQKYLDLDPSGPYAADAKGMLTAAGIPFMPGKK